MNNKRGAILGILLLFMVIPQCAYAMDADSAVLKNKIFKSYMILNEARSQESPAAIVFLKDRPPKKLKFDWLKELLSSINKYRKLTGENERFTFLEKVITQEMQEGARDMAKKDIPSENLSVLFKQEWENEKR